MLREDFYPTLETYSSGIERTDIINNLYTYDNVGSPYYLGYIDHDDFPNSFGVQLVDYSQGMIFNQIESNHSWGYCFNKNVYNSSVGTTPYLAIIQDDNGHAEQGGDRYCFLNKIKMAQQNSINTVKFALRFMYMLTEDIDESYTTQFTQNFGFASDSITATIEQIKEMVDGTADVYASWTRNGYTYPALKYSDFNEYGLALIQSTDGTRTAAICISQVNIGDSGRYSYGESTNVISAVFPFFEHDYDDKHILASQGTGQTEDPTISWYQSLGIVRPHTNFGMTYDDQLYMFAPYPYDILVEDLPTYNLYQRSGLVKGQYFLQYYAVYNDHVSFYAYAHYDLKDVYTMMLYYHKIYTDTPIFSKSYTTDISVATFNEHDGATGDRLSDDYVNIDDQLRDWQQPNTDIAVNEYDPTDKPEYDPTPPGPSPQETEPKYPGYPTLGSSARYIPTAGVNFYALNNSLVSTFIQRLWSQPKNFYEAIQIAGNQVDSIFDYIQSFRYYPLRFDFSTSNIYPVIFGTGAVLKDLDGDTNFQLSEVTPIQHTIAAGDWDLSDPIYHWRNNFLDYSPYLKMSIYIPFAGTIELSPEAVASHGDISAATITLLASFDIETGTITYYVINQANVLLAQKTAKVGIDLPLSGNNSAEQSAAILRAQFSTVKQLLGAGTSAATGAATSGLAGVASATVSTLASVGDMYLQNSLAQRAVPVEIQGMGGTFSALAGGQYPYITINRQKVSNPPNYGHTTGYLVEGTYKISSLNGFTVCRNTDVSGINQATDTEKAKIKQILESGFYA